MEIRALSDVFDDGSLRIAFSGGTSLRGHHWRLHERERRPGKGRLSSWDHAQKYGLPEPIDAVAELQELVKEGSIVASRYDRESGDLVFELEAGLKLQVLNLTGNEDWEINFPDGTVEYSNYV